DVLLSAPWGARASLTLRQLSGMDIKPDATLVSTREQLLANPLPVELGGALDKAYAANPQLATIKARGRQAQVEVDVTDNGLLPQLDLNASFGPSAAGPEFGQALSDLATFKNYTAFVGLTFSAPIGNHGPRGAYASALANLHKVRVSEEDVRAQVSVAVARAVDVVKSTQKRLEVDAVGTQLAVVNLDAEKAGSELGRAPEFRGGRRTSTGSGARTSWRRAASARRARPRTTSSRWPCSSSSPARSFPATASSSKTQPDEPHVNAAFLPVAAEGEEPLAVAARARR